MSSSSWIATTAYAGTIPAECSAAPQVSRPCGFTSLIIRGGEFEAPSSCMDGTGPKPQGDMTPGRGRQARRTRNDPASGCGHLR